MLMELPEKASMRRKAVAFVSRHRFLFAMISLIIMPLVIPYTSLAINILIMGLYAVGFNLMFGYAGALSFGHAAFLGIGAYGCGIAVVHYGVPWYGAIPIGVISATVLAAIIGYVATRVRGIYFAMVTLALSQIVFYIVLQMREITGGDDGLRGVNVPRISFFGLDINLHDPMARYYFVLVFVGISLWILSRILNSPFGAVLEAIRENEDRARASGYNIAASRLLAFTLSGTFCGVAGALYAIHLSIVPLELLHYTTSGLAVVMALLGGMGTFFGPFVGAAAFLVIEDVLTLWTVHWQLFVGALVVLFVIFFPRGIWGTFVHWLSR
jgi:branched-chain amino acid transport system permease protein